MFRGDSDAGKHTAAMAVTGRKSQPASPVEGPEALPSRSAAAQRRAMQAALAAAVMAMRSQDNRRVGGRAGGRRS
jgi:hypothetical protein